jgi:predicted helicase
MEDTYKMKDEYSEILKDVCADVGVRYQGSLLDFARAVKEAYKNQLEATEPDFTTMEVLHGAAKIGKELLDLMAIKNGKQRD